MPTRISANSFEIWVRRVDKRALWSLFVYVQRKKKVGCLTKDVRATIFDALEKIVHRPLELLNPDDVNLINAELALMQLDKLRSHRQQ